jgi:hypothetical protein
MRTHTILVGDNQELLTSFWEAVAMFRKDKGIESITGPDEPPSKTHVPHPRET